MTVEGKDLFNSFVFLILYFLSKLLGCLLRLTAEYFQVGEAAAAFE